MSRKKKSNDLDFKKKSKTYALLKNKYRVYIFSSLEKNKNNRIKFCSATVNIDNNNRKSIGVTIGDKNIKVKNKNLIKDQYFYFDLDLSEFQLYKKIPLEVTIETADASIYVFSFFIKKIDEKYINSKRKENENNNNNNNKNRESTRC